MPFDPDDPRLTAFALGELEPADRDAIEAILRDDPDGRAFVVSIEDTARLLAEELRHESSAVNGLASSHRDTIERSLAAPILAMTTAPAKRTWIGRHVFEIAAAASLIGVGIGLMWPGPRFTHKGPAEETQIAQADPSLATLHDAKFGWSDASARSAQFRSLRPVPPPVNPGEAAPASNLDLKVTVHEKGNLLSARSSGADRAPAAKPASAAVAGSTPLVNPPIDHRLGNRIPVPMSSPLPQAAASSRMAMPLGVTSRERDNRSNFANQIPGTFLKSTNQPVSGPAAAVPPNQAGGSMGMMGRTAGRMPGGPGGMGGGMGGYPGGLGRGAGAKHGAGGAIGGGMMGMAGEKPDTKASVALSYARFGEARLGEVGRRTAEPMPAKVPPAQQAPAKVKSDLPLNQGVAGPRGVALPKILVGPEEGLAKNALAQSESKSKDGAESQKQENNHFYLNPKGDSKSALGIDPNRMFDVTRAGEAAKAAPDAGNAANGNGEKKPSDGNGGQKPSEPQQMKLAINDGEQQRINVLQEVVAHKEAEIQQLNQQVEGFQRQVIVEQARVGREAYARLYDNPFTNVVPGSQLSTFAVDVDTASYANVRRFLTQGQLPPVDAVRIEEMVNYFSYDDPAPTGPDPFSVNVELAACPWDGTHRLARIGLKGKTVDADKRPPSNLVFLIDVSGSMNDLNKLPMLKAGMKLLVGQLTENDRVAVVTYSNEVRVALPSTPCHRKDEILAVLDGLNAGGGTNGGAGVQKAYELAQANFIKAGTNRVILATDGDFNLGLTKEQLLATSEERAKGGIFLSVLGFGQGNIQEEFMEQLADKGNGNYSYIDTIDEARRVLVTRIAGTLVVIAKDVKVQVEFNPDKVSAYRLIGYENRVMANEDFRNDKKDAGEIGAGHSVTALYEIVPSVVTPKVAAADRPLKYVRAVDVADKAKADADAKAKVSLETLTVYLRYKQPDGDKATEFSKGVTDDGRDFGRASTNLKFASAVAGFGMILRESPYKGSATLPAVLEIAGSALGDDKSGDRKEFLELVKQAERITAPQ